MDLRRWLSEAYDEVSSQAALYEPFIPHPSLQVPDDVFAPHLAELTSRLRTSHPFFHPFYAGQMLKPPHPAAVVGYLAAMLVNSNNHALDGGPATSALELEVVADLAGMFGMRPHLGHLTSGGTVANLEALWVAREEHPDRGVAHSEDSHYTHSRMCGVLRTANHPVPTDAAGRMDLDALAAMVRKGDVGTVVATAGTTSMGAVDPIADIVELCREHGVRVHVDAAYGGFFTLLAGPDRPDLAPETARHLRAIADCDSVVVDPHKHGLQPYGCGAVLFADPGVARHYGHDSPYTYFTSDDLHLGQISLECSRSGAAAAALWLTLRALPLTPQGLGAALAAGRQAAVTWAELLAGEPALRLYQVPELDIITCFPARARMSEIDEASGRILSAGMADPATPIHVSTLTASARDLVRRHPDVVADREQARLVRSVLMKPESQTYIGEIHARVAALAR